MAQFTAPEGNPIENRITNRFVGHLENVIRKRAKDRIDQLFSSDGSGTRCPCSKKRGQDACPGAKGSLPPFRFSYRPKLADAASDTESGEVDICITSFSVHPEAYFVFECKRLNVQTIQATIQMPRNTLAMEEWGVSFPASIQRRVTVVECSAT